MISANDLRNVQISEVDLGYSTKEVRAVLEDAASTIEAYQSENEELYHKLEVLAGKIEDYRKEEDSIKTALITAQKMADRIKKDSTEEAARLTASSKTQADTVISDAKSQADRIISEAREFSSSMIKQKTDEADAILADAEKKSNDAINSSQIVAQNILDQAKEISDELVKKSQDEKEAYELLNASLRRNAAAFIDNVKALYTEQLNALNGAKLYSSEDEPSEAELNSVKGEVNSLVNEIDEMKNAIPGEVKLEKPEYTAPVEDAPVYTESAAAVEDEVKEESADEAAEQPAFEPAAETEAETDAQQDLFNITEEAPDPMEAVAAFSADEITPIDKSKPVIPEINDEPEAGEKSLFDEKLPFENYFNVKTEDAHLDKTQTISLTSPDEDEDDGEEPKFKGFFKKKK